MTNVNKYIWERILYIWERVWYITPINIITVDIFGNDDDKYYIITEIFTYIWKGGRQIWYYYWDKGWQILYYYWERWW